MTRTPRAGKAINISKGSEIIVSPATRLIFSSRCTKSRSRYVCQMENAVFTHFLDQIHMTQRGKDNGYRSFGG